jgi:hypothetical protein
VTAFPRWRVGNAGRRKLSQPVPPPASSRSAASCRDSCRPRCRVGDSESEYSVPPMRAPDSRLMRSSRRGSAMFSTNIALIFSLADLPDDGADLASRRLGIGADADRGDEADAVGAAEVGESVVRADDFAPVGRQAAEGGADFAVESSPSPAPGGRRWPDRRCGLAGSASPSAARCWRRSGERWRDPARHAGRGRRYAGVVGVLAGMRSWLAQSALTPWLATSERAAIAG